MSMFQARTDLLNLGSAPHSQAVPIGQGEPILEMLESLADGTCFSADQQMQVPGFRALCEAPTFDKKTGPHSVKSQVPT